MAIIALSEDDYYEHLAKQHNPPDAAAPPESFDEEYYRLFDRVAAIISDHGENGSDGDCFLEPHISQSRGFGFEVANATIIAEHLLSRLQALLAQHAPDWELFLGSSQCDFGIFIGPTSIHMHRHNNLLPQLNAFVANVG